MSLGFEAFRRMPHTCADEQTPGEKDRERESAIEREREHTRLSGPQCVRMSNQPIRRMSHKCADEQTLQALDPRVEWHTSP